MKPIENTQSRLRWLPTGLLLLAVLGCGTTRWTDTKRSATEQLLITDAMDRAVSRLDFEAVADKETYLDTTHITKTTDYQYLISTLRQHLLASGCLLRDKREEADYVVEVRVGAIGTNHHDVLLGVPANKLPELASVPGVPTAIPEVSLIKKTEQRAIAKIAVFAYNRRTGRPVWQSGSVPVESAAKDIWILGAGPFQRGNIYKGMSFAGDRLSIPFVNSRKKRTDDDVVSVASEARYEEPVEMLASKQTRAKEKATPVEAKAKETRPSKSAGHVLPANHSVIEKPDEASSRRPAAARPPAEGHLTGQPLPPKPINIPSNDLDAAPMPAEPVLFAGPPGPEGDGGPSWPDTTATGRTIDPPSGTFDGLRRPPAPHSTLW